MKILGIDTSCDDTAIGIIEYINNKQIILSNVKYTQLLRNGGVIPEIASRDHVKYIDQILYRALEEAKVTLDDIDIIAATCGPGLTRCLIIGYNFGMTLARIHNKIFIPVHHIEGHILITPNIEFPCCICIVSGGHTMLVYCEKFGSYTLLGQTRDDAAGEVFDKIAKLLNYSNGADIERLANQSSKNQVLTIAIRESFDFSFSGIKTAVSKIQDSAENIAKILQNTIIANLIYKIEKAMKQYNLSTCIICGGVASNKSLRKYDFLIAPPIELCVDNGAMIAAAASFHYNNQTSLVNKYDLDIFARMSLNDFYNKYITK